MGGIAAIYHRDGSSVPGEHAARMAGALRLHGPRKTSSETVGGFGLAAALSPCFAPEDQHDRQPVKAGERWALLFTGFLTDRDALIETLGIDRATAARMADSALALVAWQKWAGDMPLRVPGNYAAIVCDRDHGRLLAIRSTGNAPPLYYHESPARLIVASAPKAIFALGDVPRDIDERRVAASLRKDGHFAGRSFFTDINALPSAHLLEATGERIAVRRYYDSRNAPDVRFARHSDYIEAAEALFARAIAGNMRALATPAIALSSGLDSSSVAVGALEYLARADHAGAERLLGLTSVPEQGWDGRVNGLRRAGDESGPVRALAAAYPGLDARFCDSAGKAIDADLDQLILLAEAPPNAIGNMHWIVQINRMARQEGRGVMLNGVGGNRTLSFSNRNFLSKLLRQGRLLRLARELGEGDDSLQLRLSRLYRRAIAPNLPERLAKRLHAVAGDIPVHQHSAIDPDYARDMPEERGVARDQEGFDHDYAYLRDARGTMGHMLERAAREDAMVSNAAVEALTGVQAREPLADIRLVEFCAGLPDEVYTRRGKDRLLIRQMMQGRLPPEILGAPKGRQAADWHLRISRELPRYRSQVDRLADDPDMRRRLDIPRLRRLIDNWPDRTPTSTADYGEFWLAIGGLSRALSTARFIDWVGGRNR